MWEVKGLGGCGICFSEIIELLDTAWFIVVY